MKLTIFGAGAIGGTIGAHMIRAGHEIQFCDIDEAHVARINQFGLTIEGPIENFQVNAKAYLPSNLPTSLGNIAIAVKSHHTTFVLETIKKRIEPGAFVVSFQNGFTYEEIASEVGMKNLLVGFVNFGADYLEPGRILQGNIGAFRVGEIAQSVISPRVQELVAALPYAKATDNILGFLWSKEAYGAMLYAGATSDLSIADHLVDPRYRPLMLAVSKEVLAQAPVKPESFDGFDPDDLEGSLNRLAEFNRNSAKKHSGIYRDLTIRKRKTEVEDLIKDLKGPLTNLVGTLIQSIERGERVCEVANLDLLATYERAIRLGTPLNAIQSLIPAPARALNGALKGTAIAVKDIVDIAGQPRGNGNPIDIAGSPSQTDAPLIKDLRGLAADIFATTSLLEYAAGATHPEVPEAMNPVNPRLTAGGSSGGSAAVVGAGITSVAIGTDTGGSIRIPAHYCGVVGYKPTYNTLSLQGVTPLSPTFDHVGLITSDVTECRRVMTALDPRFESKPDISLMDLRIGIFPKHFALPQLQDDVRDLIAEAIRRIQNQGAIITELSSEIPDELEKTFEPILLFESWQVHGAKITSDPDHYGPETLRFLRLGGAISKGVYEEALERRLQLLDEYRKFYESVDLILTPACPYVAPTTTPPMDTPEGAVEGAYTALFNLTGEPAIVLPCGRDSNGLPIGLQLVTAFGTDSNLLAISEQVEALFINEVR